MPESRLQQITDEPDLGVRAEMLLGRVESLEKELAELQGLATLGTLAGAIAHEFNNILTPIVTFAEMALEAPEDTELAQRALRKALEGSERASFIASALLGFARRDHEGESSDVERVIRDVQACLVRDPQQDGVELSVVCEPVLYADMSPGALHQVMLNLVLNALEAMRPVGGSLRLSASRSTGNTRAKSGGVKPAPDMVTIEVTDSGPGLPTSVKDHLFEPFQRGATRPGGRRGTGLGLAVCKKLVEEAGGSINADSEPGRGTTFRINLPAATCDSSS